MPTPQSMHAPRSGRPGARRRSRLLLVLVMLSLCLPAGCSSRPRPYPIQGSVVFPDCTPLAGGRIEFRSLEHQITARGRVERDGSFQMTTYETHDGAVKGQHQVLVVQQFAVGFGEQIQDPRHSHGVRLDRKFNRYDTSGLEVTVLGQNQPQEIVIEISKAD